VPPSATRSPIATPIRITAGQNDVSTTGDGERKTVTALFADIKGSTELIRGLDPEDARALVDPVLRLMIEAVHRYDGYVAQSTGDGIFALFGAPAAYEDHPQRALYAALAMQQAIRERAAQYATHSRPAIEARVGVSTGEVVVRTIEAGGHSEYTPIGLTANLAARLETVAAPGSVAVSAEIRRLCEGYFTFRALGPAALKGLAEPVEVYEVAGLGPLRTHFELAARRGLTRFVGREAELAQMQRGLEVARGGRGQLIAVVAEAGTGKSRLFYEFKARLPAECRLLEAYSVSHGKASAWLPVLELLRGYFGLRDADDAAVRRNKIGAALATLDPALNETLPYLLGLLGIQEGPDPLAQMDPRIRRQRTLEALKRIIVRESLEQALVLIFEDLHWIDAETQALLDLLADSVAGARLLLLVNYRPEYRHEWAGRSHYLQLRLDPLGGESAVAMVDALLGDGAELAPLKRLLCERTGGNPFFIEEMVQALFDDGVLARNGAVRLVQPLSQTHLPVTVQGVLAARIDRLSAELKELLQTLAVMGRESSLSLINKVADKGEAQLERMLRELRAGEFIYEQPAVGDIEYAFKHALTQEVAYNSVLLERRRLLHERIGAALEAAFADNLDDQLAELAHHYARSANRAKAFEFLHRAGAQAVRRASYAEAESYLAAALEVLAAMPESPERDARELRVRSSFSNALVVTNGYGAPEALDMAARARALAEKTGNLPRLVQQLVTETLYAYVRGDYSAAAVLADQLLEVAQREGSPVSLGLGHSTQLRARFIRGDCPGAEEHFERGRAFFDAPGFLRPGAEVGTFGWASFLAWVTGRADTARERIRRCLEGTQRNPYDVAHGQMLAASLYNLLGEFARAEALAAKPLSQCEERGFPELAPWSLAALGYARGELGRTGEGVALLRQAVASATASGVRLHIVGQLTRLARLQMLDGAIADALGTIEDALTANPEELVSRPAAYRVRGELRLKQGERSLAEADFHEAIALARKMSAKAYELRATMSLARLLRDTNRRDEARTMLAEIYGWFTEGFDTADLKDAKALFDELSN
jgi:class 3 adenylate cyclase/tetratricopeptide (TPR) repeat protein